MDTKLMLVILSALAQVVFSEYSYTYSNISCDIVDFPDDIPWAVSKIDLSKNSLLTVHFDTPYPFLRTVNFYKNNMTSFPTTESNNTAKLRKMNLNSNKISSIDFIPRDAFENLDELYLSNNRLPEFPDLTNISSTLTILDVSMNKINHIASERLEPLRYLESIYLSNNPITHIPDTTFLGNITSIELKYLDMVYFPHLPNFLYSATQIDFSNNEGFTIDYVDNYANLQILLMKDCSYGGIFPDLANLSTTLSLVDMTNSGTTFVPPEHIASLSTLNFLILHGSPITVLPDVDLVADRISLEVNSADLREFPILPLLGPSVIRLLISNNNLTIRYIGHFDVIDTIAMTNCKYGGYFPDFSNVSNTLRYLELSDNAISYINPTYLDDLVVLLELRLNNNPISIIPDVAGPGNSLKTIILSNSTLTEFPHIPLLGRTLEILDIDGEYQGYRGVSHESLQALPRLKRLNMNHVALEQLPDLTRRNWTTPLTMYLAEVQLECGDTTKMLNIMALRGIINIQGAPTCAPGGLHADQLVTNLRPRHFAQVYSEGRLFYGSSKIISDISQYYGYLAVDKIIPDTIPGSCTMQCLLNPDCSMYATDGGNCVLTKWAAGTEAEFTTYQKWFLVN